MSLFKLFKHKSKDNAALGSVTNSLPPSGERVGVRGCSLGVVDSLSKLIKHGYLELDLHTPRAFLSLSCYRAFMCDKSGIFIDDARARAFLGNIRFYINFQRAYLSGVRQGLIDDALGTDEDDPAEKWKFPPLADDAFIDIYISGSDNQSIILFGRWNGDGVELKPYKAPSPDPSPNGGE